LHESFASPLVDAWLIYFVPGDLGVQDDDMPVLRVDIVEAQRCAEWLNGLLPSVGQWDTAAGRFEDPKERGEGPFLKDWQPGDIAINRGEHGPMPVGAAKKDRSLLGCNDMAGNGFEWTRTCVDPVGEFLGRDVASLSPDTRVQLRGKDYAKYQPLRFEELNQYTTMHFFESARQRNRTAGALATVGFRVVIEVD
jgi:formylglycine-generating enzyme required for sulfatase activity